MRALAAAALTSTAASPAHAQADFPSRALRIVVPLAAGGPTDFLARAIAQDMARTLGQPVIVENKPGADGLIAAREVIAAPADGHTLLLAIGSMLAAPLQSRPPAFDWRADLAPLGRVARVPFALAVHPGVPASSVQELVLYARSHPDQLNFATSTMSELMATAQFMRAAGISMTRVPYKGGAQSMPDLMAGRVQVWFGPVSLIAPQVQAGSLRALATLLPERSPALPGVPTLAEAGYASVQVPTWQALFAPAKTPAPVLERLAAAVTAATARPEVRAEIEKRAIFVDAASAAEVGRMVAAEQDGWIRLIAQYHLGSE
ncbi:MAG: tripartite tricarboxylate transporter substrate binding protein [Burkholderiales bacterium]